MTASKIPTTNTQAFLEFLIQGAHVFSRRPQAAFHDQLLAFLGQEKIDEQQRAVRVR